jgi:hypothetical protein
MIFTFLMSCQPEDEYETQTVTSWVTKATILLQVETEIPWNENEITLMNLDTKEPLLKVGNRMFNGIISESVGSIYVMNGKLRNNKINKKMLNMSIE